LTNGNFAETAATISVKSGLLPAVTDTSITLETVTQPAITGTIANEPVASGVGAAIRPFATVRITDDSPGFNAKDTGTITVTDASGTPSDADGLLSGTGLSKTGVGTYTVATAFFFEIQNNLEGLVFMPSAVAAGSTRTTGFKLNIKDAATTLNTDDTTTSVLVIGPAVTPTAPLIAGTMAGQTVAPGNAISPFNGVTISDANTTPVDSATLTVTGGGTLSGAGLSNAGGTYTIAATTPAALTAILDRVSFAAPALATGQTSVTSSITLKVVDGALTTTDNTTTVIEAAPSQPLQAHSGNFAVADQTTGQQSFLAGDKYIGPVPGLDQQLILVTPDNVNISATIPNVFLHSGGGSDALNVSSVNGNNILDGSTGSNFLVGGTGRDTFFLDDRNLTMDVFSTVVGFHSGDNVTIFGVDPTSPMSVQDNLGAVGFKGLTYTFSAPGKPNASIAISGYSTADLINGRLAVNFGSNADLPGQPGSGGPYLNIHGN